MAVETTPLNPGDPVTEKGDRAHLALIEIIQRLREQLADHEARIAALEP